MPDNSTRGNSILGNLKLGKSRRAGIQLFSLDATDALSSHFAGNSGASFGPKRGAVIVAAVRPDLS